MLSPYAFGNLPIQPSIWFEQLEPSIEYADFSYDAASLISPGDTITGLSMNAAPSGAGEVNLSRLGLYMNSAGAMQLVTVWITGGVPGRTYLYRLNVYTALIRVLTVTIGQVADPLLAPACPIPPPPNPGFGSLTTWGVTY